MDADSNGRVKGRQHFAHAAPMASSLVPNSSQQASADPNWQGCDGFLREDDRPHLITSGYSWLIPFAGISLYRDGEHEVAVKRPKTSETMDVHQLP